MFLIVGPLIRILATRAMNIIKTTNHDSQTSFLRLEETDTPIS